MSTYTDTFTAGETKQYGRGLFLKIISATNNVDVAFRNSDGTLIDKAEGVSQGDAFQSPKGFDYAEVTSATAQTVKIQLLKLLMTSTALIGAVSASTTRVNKVANGNQYYFRHTGAGIAGSGFQRYFLENPSGSGVYVRPMVFEFGYSSSVAVRAQVVASASIIGTDATSTKVFNHIDDDLASGLNAKVYESGDGAAPTSGFKYFYGNPTFAIVLPKRIDDTLTVKYASKFYDDDLLLDEGSALELYPALSAGLSHNLFLSFEEIAK